MYQAGLVLEGGGMKGVYTAGVLDFFLEKGIEFSSVYGVSAGACCMCSYLSKQPERAYDVFVDYLGSKNYMSLYSLITTGDLFNVQTTYDLIPNHLNPFEFDTYAAYQGKAYAVVTNIISGQPEYKRIKDLHKEMCYIQASSSLPLVSKNVKIGNKIYLDGGISDAIPIQKSILDGNRKNVVIMTKEEGFRRKPAEHLALIKLRYAKYPAIYELMQRRHIAYNKTLDYMENQVKNGQAFVIRPHKKSEVGRVEKDETKLRALYEEGYRDGERYFDSMMAYLA